MPPWPRPILSFFFWVAVVVVCCYPLGLRAATVVVQSTDPAIEYIGVWEHVQPPNDTAAYVVSNTTGSKAVYTFAGTKISVFGVVLPRDPPGIAQVSEYSIDGGAPTRYTAPGGVTGATYNIQFFSASSLSSQGQHTLTIVNLGDEFILARFEVTLNPTHFNPTGSAPGSGAGPSFTSTSSESSATSAPSDTSARIHVPSTSSQSTSGASNETLTSTNASTFSSTLPSMTLASTTSSSSSSILSTSSSSLPSSGLTQGRTTALSKGATIGGGIAGTLGFLLLVGGLCWYGQRRGLRKRQGSSSDPKAPLGMHNVTSQVTVGSDPFVSDVARLRRGLAPPLYIPVGSASELSTRDTQYTYTNTSPQRPNRPSHGYGYGYGDEKYGMDMDDAPLRSPVSPISVSASNLLDDPNPHYRHTPASTTSPTESPIQDQVRRIDGDGRRRSADGGVRIAGGRPGQRVDDTDESFLDLGGSRRSTSGSTLPPAYDFDE